MKEIKSLTGVRGIAAIYVVLYHFTNAKIPFIWNGYLAVDLFFVLSGFIMCMVYYKNFESEISVSEFGKFLWHRFARIYPLYLFVLISTIIIQENESSLPSTQTLIINFMMWQNLFNNGMVGASWSVSVELIAYLIFPALILLLANKKWICFIVIYTSMSILFYITTIDNPGSSGPLDIYSGIPSLMRGICGFSIGVCCYVLFNKYKSILNVITYTQDILAALLIVCLLIKGMDVIFVILTGLYISSLYYSTGITGWLLSTKPIHYLGELSFSIYLTHLMIQRNFIFEVNAITEYLNVSYINDVFVMVISTLMLSMLTFHLVEKPSRNILRKLK
ncbi:acyltransferase family protein [Salmonella enterica]|uniref:acyltransferase family protein n=1 Tax=Salmonella enterica TaxID=28901 RepID=UPI00111A8E3A|nr:acyltransferase [Salmonella enterica]EBG6487556.1 acyltransferase [Salmonella enterica]EHJ8504312.1 acyltransferase [Salmonella enterica subsp. diarizonae serovar 47:k:z53:[z84]]EHU3753196.1 acyltransferase [Salmonella enterica]WGI48277.1 acyltransferase [Salmonella enterica subsp. diarizonae serovar 48:i:z]